MAPVDEIKEHLEKAESIIGHAAEISGRYREALKQDPRPLPERQEEVRQSLQVLGPPAWKVMFKVPETLPCDDCVQHGVSYVSAQRDAVNHKIGKPLHDPANVRRVQEEFCKIPVPSGAESLNTENAKGTGDTKMAFQLKGKTSQIVRLYVAGAVGGGVSFAIVDKYLIGPAAGLDQQTKDLAHLGIGVLVTAAGIGFNRLPIAELGAAYTAVPIARFVGGLLPAPTGFAGARFAAPGGFPTGLIVNGRIGPVGATVSGVKTF